MGIRNGNSIRIVGPTVAAARFIHTSVEAPAPETDFYVQINAIVKKISKSNPTKDSVINEFMNAEDLPLDVNHWKMVWSNFIKTNGLKVSGPNNMVKLPLDGKNTRRYLEIGYGEYSFILRLGDANDVLCTLQVAFPNPNSNIDPNTHPSIYRCTEAHQQMTEDVLRVFSAAKGMIRFPRCELEKNVPF